MVSERYDLIVLGSGPGGYVSAIRGAQLGFKVAIVEKESLGGVCLNWGCIPTKALLRSAEVFELFSKASQWGIEVEGVSPNLSAIIKRSRKIAEKLSRGVAFLMKKNDITVYSGRGRLVGKGEVLVEGENPITLKAPRVLLATGAIPRPLPNHPFDGEKIIAYRDALLLDTLPEKLLIIGAGAIGMEFAYFYHTFGVSVTVIELLPRVLPFADEEVSQALEKHFKKQGIAMHTQTQVQAITFEGEKVKIQAKRGEEALSFEGDKVLVAIGVKAQTEDLGLEEVGVTVEKGWIKVDESYATTTPGIWAIGDCIGPPLLAHAASEEGIRAVEGMVGEVVNPLLPEQVPSCVYTHPQVAMVGLTEEQAKERGYEVKVGRFPYKPNGKALAMEEMEGFVKVVIDAKYGELLGCHIYGAEATEMIMEWTVAMEAEATYQQIISSIHPHPTLHEMVKEAVEEAFGRAIHL